MSFGYSSRFAKIEENRNLLERIADFKAEKIGFDDLFEKIFEKHRFLSEALIEEYNLSSRDVSNFTDGKKAPKPSDMRSMVGFISKFAESIIEDPDSTPYELRPQYLRAVEGRVAPNSLRTEEERPSHRPAPQARLSGQMHARL